MTFTMKFTNKIPKSYIQSENLKAIDLPFIDQIIVKLKSIGNSFLYEQFDKYTFSNAIAQIASELKRYDGQIKYAIESDYNRYVIIVRLAPLFSVDHKILELAFSNHR